jgi:hypothetical protein
LGLSFFVIHACLRKKTGFILYHIIAAAGVSGNKFHLIHIFRGNIFIPYFLISLLTLFPSRKGPVRKEMSDFVQSANIKRSVRNLTIKIADVAALNTLFQGVIDTNAFQCVNDNIGGTTSGCFPWISPRNRGSEWILT